MPRVKVGQTEEARRGIRGAIKNAMELAGLDRQGTAKKSGIAYSTLCKRIGDPLTMTVGELLKISRATGMPVVIGGTNEGVKN